ncbi:MAG TPA: WecB/TagA/CpsF family glycosyltransferase [Longimicrobiaceae bacterium]|nr:WecB/TagA/CpsF family glycosyltransferase [Longimicrobiaceae bacterium]
MSAGRVDVCGAGIDPCTLEEAVRRIVDRARAGGPPEYVVTPNAHHVVLLQDSELFRRIYDAAWLSVADGMSVVWASRILGRPLPGKVSGIDLFQAVCGAAAGTGLRVFLLGGRPGAAAEAARVMRAARPELVIAGTYCPPMGFENDPAESARALQAVRAAAPHILFVALGAPKQEIWMYENRARLGVPVSAGVGAAFDFAAGFVRRAPRWMQRTGLEWVFRVLMEPGRLGRRYAVTNPRFVRIFLRHYLRNRRATRRESLPAAR